MLNRIVLIGRLTRDPELKQTSSGVAVCTFTLAVDRQFKAANGEKETDFINIVVWRKTAETCATYLSKGKLASVDGRLQLRSYEANDGTKRTATEVVAENVCFLSPKNEANQAARDQYNPIFTKNSVENSAETAPIDNLPF